MSATPPDLPSVEQARLALQQAQAVYDDAIAAADERNGYRIALRPDDEDPGVLDDVVVVGVSTFRAEDLGDGWWLCCYLAGTDERIDFWMGRRGKRTVMTVTDLPAEHPEITYEKPRHPTPAAPVGGEGETP